MRHGKYGFLYRGIRRLTIRKDVPRNERTVKLLIRGRGPACTQQSLIREQSIESNAVQRLLCPIKVARFEKDGTKHQVRLVADRETGGISRHPLSCLVQLLDRFLLSIRLQQSDTEVVGNKSSQTLIGPQRFEHLHRFGRLACRHINVCPQELDVVFYFHRHHTLDPSQRVLCIVELTLLEMDARKPERRFVSHGFIDGAFEHRLDGATCTVVHAIVEFEVAYREFSVVDVIVQRIEVWLVETPVHSKLGIEALKGIEKLSLVGVIKRLSEKQVLQVAAHHWLRDKSQS